MEALQTMKLHLNYLPQMAQMDNTSTTNSSADVKLAEETESTADSDMTQTESAFVDILALLPPKPQEPLPEDCCGSGCTPCIMDIYEQEQRLWEKECQGIQRGLACETEDRCIISPDKYRQFQLLAITPEGRDTHRYRFGLPQGTSLPLKTGQHLVLRWKDRGLTRQYTPVNGQGMVGSFEVVIKTYPEGKMSDYIRDWKTGQMVEWRGPLGRIVQYAGTKHYRVVMLAAGTGIAPMTQVCRAILDNEADETHILLLYCSHSYDDVLCTTELREWKDYWNFKLVHFLSQELQQSQKCPGHREGVVSSRLTKDHLQQYFVDARDTECSLVLICGPRSFDQDMICYLQELEIPPKHVYKF